MIDSIELVNFQSHKNSLLEFDSGINAIVGPSNNGKTAILRGLYLTRYNQPSGDAFISKWARDSKGKQKKQMSVTIGKDGQYIVRGKGPDLNGYDINGSVYEALGKGGLPPAVPPFFNTTEVNIQEQMDRPFLIGSTPTEVAKFLNDIVDMSEIDLYLSAAESKKRSNSKDVKRIAGEIKDLEKELSSFDRLSEIEVLASKSSKIELRRTAKQISTDQLSEDIHSLKRLNKTIASTASTDDIASMVKKITMLKSRAEQKEANRKELESSTLRYKVNNNILEQARSVKKLSKRIMDMKALTSEKLHISEKLDVVDRSVGEYVAADALLESSVDTKKVMALLKKLSQVKVELSKIQNKYLTVKTNISEYKTYSNYIKNTDLDVKKLEDQLPEICPTCNQPWHRGDHT